MTDDKTEKKKIETSTSNTIDEIKPTTTKVEKAAIQNDVYPNKKYVDKNEELEKLIDKIPVIKKTTTVIGQESKPQIHKVEGGETLYFLSRKYGVTVDEIKKLNNLLDNSLDIGQELIISQKH